MNAKSLIVPILAMAAAGCGKPGNVAVVFKGATPATSAVQSARVPEFHCPVCNHLITTLTPPPKVCPSKACQAKISWPDEVGCAYCGRTGECPTCRMMKQDRGLCYNCRGEGKLVLMGQTRPCPNCKETKGKCPTCKGTGKCDFCGGEKTVPMDKLQKAASPEPEKQPEKEPEKQPEKAAEEAPPPK